MNDSLHFLIDENVTHQNLKFHFKAIIHLPKLILPIMEDDCRYQVILLEQKMATETCSVS